MQLIFTFFVLLMTSVPQALAGSQTGTVKYIIVRDSDGLIYFALTGGAASNKPSCATIGYWMLKDENSTTGMMQYSMLLSAQASGLTLRVTGYNTCSRWGDGEDVNSIQIIK